MLSSLMLDGMTVLSVCFPSLFSFLFFWVGILCAFSSASDTLGYGVGGCLYSFLLFLEYWMSIHDDMS